MRILDKTGRELTDPDLNLGYLTEERVVKQHHDAVAAVPEKGHWQDIPDHEGAQAWIVDQPDVSARDAWDEYETVQRYIPYTEEELAARASEQAGREAASLRASQTTVALGLLIGDRSPSLSDAEAEQVSALFPDWRETGVYKVGQVVRYRNNLYRALQAFTSQKDWTPDTASSLWKRVGTPDKAGVWPWSQPLGATDAYKKNSVVTHNNKTWTSDIDANVWEPGVYGWTEKTGTTNDNVKEYIA